MAQSKKARIKYLLGALLAISTPAIVIAVVRGDPMWVIVAGVLAAAAIYGSVIFVLWVCSKAFAAIGWNRLAAWLVLTETTKPEQ